MRVGIDARMYRLSGVGTYLENLLKGLAELDGETEYICFVREEEVGSFSPPGPNFRAIPCRPSIYSLKEQWSLPLLASRHGLDLIHYPHYASPLFNPCPTVITVHDLIHLLFPQYLPGLFAYAYARSMFLGACHRARLIIAVSENTRQDL
ncbi:MAG: glycosyltransferase, partial [Nitrospinota bacterium]